MAEKILIVDDDVAICKTLQKVLGSYEMESDTANSGTEALCKLGKHTYDAILMDINMDDMEGFEVIKRLRSQGITTPVMIVSGRSEDFDALYGLSVGADDYITKPFRPVVVGAKVKALVRRSKQTDSGLSCGRFRYDATSLRLFKDDVEISLTGKENGFMMLFMKHPNQVFTKEMLYQHVWGDSIVVDDNTIMVYINHLRNKIEDDSQHPRHILTVRGMGYRFSGT